MDTENNYRYHTGTRGIPSSRAQENYLGSCGRQMEYLYSYMYLWNQHLTYGTRVQVAPARVPVLGECDEAVKALVKIWDRSRVLVPGLDSASIS